MKALSFFSGAMGFDQGLEAVGIEILMACENNKYAIQTIKANKPALPVFGNLENLLYDPAECSTWNTFLQNNKYDLIFGGPPCQAFSSIGLRRGFKDARGLLLTSFLDISIAAAPQFIVIENVRGLLSAKLPDDNETGGILKYVKRRLEAANYSVSFDLYNAANFGAPQKRERIIIIAAKDGPRPPYLQPTHSEDGGFGLPKWRTLRECVTGLSSCTYAPFSEKRLKYFRMLKPGECWRHLPKELQEEAMGKCFHLQGGKTGHYRRLDFDEPSPTLVTHPAMFATSLCHPTEDRPLSVEEYARIQEFPDTWTICGSIDEKYKQLGNAVPLSLGKAVGQLLKNYNSWTKMYDNFKHFPYSRYSKTNDSFFS